MPFGDETLPTNDNLQNTFSKESYGQLWLQNKTLQRSFIPLIILW